MKALFVLVALISAQTTFAAGKIPCKAEAAKAADALGDKSGYEQCHARSRFAQQGNTITVDLTCVAQDGYDGVRVDVTFSSLNGCQNPQAGNLVEFESGEDN